MAEIFNFGLKGAYGTMYKIVPETTNHFVNKKNLL